MKNWIHLPLAAVVAVLVGLGTAFLSSPARGAETHDAGADVTALRATLAQLESEQQKLAERLSTLPSAPSAPAANRAPVQNMDEAIAAYMAKQLSGGAPSDDANPLEPADLESAAIADRIVSGQVKGDELQALWQKLRQEKRIDAVVAEIERQAGLAPNNPDMQDELGKAYLQKLFDVGIGPMAAKWGDKADQAFDRALEIDDTHWDARFHKAVSLSNSPGFLGKQSEAIHQFEILMGQQERGAPEAGHARTYYYLGNMYEQGGEHDKALATWKRGLALYPDDGDLRAKSGGGR